MMRYRLRTLLIVLALGPPTIAAIWFYPWIVLFGLYVVLNFALAYGFAWTISTVNALIAKIPRRD
jgi:hypothetical protein